MDQQGGSYGGGGLQGGYGNQGYGGGWGGGDQGRGGQQSYGGSVTSSLGLGTQSVPGQGASNASDSSSSSVGLGVGTQSVYGQGASADGTSKQQMQSAYNSSIGANPQSHAQVTSLKGQADQYTSAEMANQGILTGQRQSLLGAIDGLASNKSQADALSAAYMGAGLLSPIAGALLSAGDLGQKAATGRLSNGDMGNVVGLASSLVGGLPGLGLNIAGRFAVGDTSGAVSTLGGVTGSILGNALAPGVGGVIGGKVGGYLGGTLAGMDGGAATETGNSNASIGNGGGLLGGGNFGNFGQTTQTQTTSPQSISPAQVTLDASIPNVGYSKYSFFN